MKRLEDPELDLVEQRSRRGGFDVAAPVAATGQVPSDLASDVPALAALKRSIIPFGLRQVRPAVLVSFEPSGEVYQTLSFENVHF